MIVVVSLEQLQLVRERSQLFKGLREGEIPVCNELSRDYIKSHKFKDVLFQVLIFHSITLVEDYEDISKDINILITHNFRGYPICSIWHYSIGTDRETNPSLRRLERELAMA